MLVSNHPQLAGGSHLPDITVITPVWEGGRVVFFVASRGHHAGAAQLYRLPCKPLLKCKPFRRCRCRSVKSAIATPATMPRTLQR